MNHIGKWQGAFVSGSKITIDEEGVREEYWVELVRRKYLSVEKANYWPLTV